MPDDDKRIADIVAQSKSKNTFMVQRAKLFPRRRKVFRGDLLRGISGLPKNTDIRCTTTLYQGREQRAKDWRRAGLFYFGYRVAGPNQSPKLLIPATGDTSVRIVVNIRWRSKANLRALALTLNEQPMRHQFRFRYNMGPYSFGEIELTGPLREAKASIVQFQYTEPVSGTEKLNDRLAVGKVVVAPSPSLKPPS